MLNEVYGTFCAFTDSSAAGSRTYNPPMTYTTYDVRTHHTNVDTYERVREEDLKQNALCLAWFAYKAAMMDRRFPRNAQK